MGARDFEAARRARTLPAREIEHVSARKHNREAIHPGSRGPVLERGGARRIGGDDAADERAGECRHRRKPPAAIGEKGLQRRERNAGARADVAVADPFDRGQPLGRQNQPAVRRGAAGDRRLGADRQDSGARRDEPRDFRFGARPGDALRMASGKMRGVFEMRRDRVGARRSRRPIVHRAVRAPMMEAVVTFREQAGRPRTG